MPSEAFQELRRVSKMVRFANTALYRFTSSKMFGRNLNMLVILSWLDKIKHSRMDQVKLVEESL